MVKINKKLDSLANFYDHVDLEKECDFSRAIKVKGQMQRITLNTPMEMYTEAKQLESITGVGYQGALKTALAIGLGHLKREMRG